MKMELSYKYGFLGLGLGGTSIAAACSDATDGTNEYPYAALLVNTNKVDLDKVQSLNPKSIKKLIGDGKGAGRDLTIGEHIFQQNEEELLDLMTTHLADRDFIWISAGLGGGSGTGSVIRAIGLCLQMNKRFGLILTLPRLNERSTVNSNALQRLNRIYAAMDKLGPIIIVDNEKLFNEFMAEHPKASVEEYLKYSNEFVANAIHDKNIVTANFGVYGSTNFDSSELGKMLMTPGALHFARLEMTASEFKELKGLATMHEQKAKFVEALQTQIEKGVLSNGYDFSKTKRAAISVLAHEDDAANLFNGTMSTQLEDLLLRVAPHATESPVSFHTYSAEQLEVDSKGDRPVYFYVILAGLDLPEERIKKMIEVDKAVKQVQTFSSNNLFAEFEEKSSNILTQSNDTLDAIFGDTTSNQKEKDSDIFALLRLV